MWICREMKNNKAPLVTKMQCHAIVWKVSNFPFFMLMCLYTCSVCAYVCVRKPANEKEREKIWWIVLYMASISSPVIYGVNNRVYSQACSAVVFLFVCSGMTEILQPNQPFAPSHPHSKIHKPSLHSHLYHLALRGRTVCTNVHTFIQIVALFVHAHTS